VPVVNEFPDIFP
jgi:hypothetical protein